MDKWILNPEYETATHRFLPMDYKEIKVGPPPIYMDNDKPLILLNNSALQHASCDRNFFLTLFKGYTNKVNNQDVEFGTAFHIFAQVVEQTNDDFRVALTQAVEYFKNVPCIIDPKKKYLTIDFLKHVCMSWFTDVREEDSFEILKDKDGKALVELKFLIPFYQGAYCNIGICGTLDGPKVHRTSKLLCDADFKTTASWKQQEYLEGVKLKGQRYLYVLALKHYIENAKEDSVLAPFKNKAIGSFVDGIFIKGPKEGKSIGEVEFKRSEVMIFSKTDLEEYHLMLVNYCARVCEMYELYYMNNKLPPRQGILTGLCWNCSFSTACAMGNDSVAFEHILNRNFISKPYDPMSH